MNVVDLVALIQSIWGFLVAAGGIAAVLSGVLSGLKFVKWKDWVLVKDGMSDVWYKGLLLLSLVGLTALKHYIPDFDLKLLDAFAADLANTFGALAVILVPFLARFGEFLYQSGLRKLPLIGKSLSANKPKG